MFRFPRLLKWIAAVVILFLLLLTLFRVLFYFYYKPASLSFPADSFLMGFRLDLRVVCVFGLIMLLLCAIPYLNPFRNTRAKKNSGLFFCPSYFW